MKQSHNTPPFKSLGTRLRYLREHSDESVAEVSGAVEINEDMLELIEQGVERPSEEILMLLISHFEMQDIEAVQLWELAGYDRQSAPDNVRLERDDNLPSRSMVMMLAIDLRTQYTDGVNIQLNKAGLTMNFTQAGANNQNQSVARVGMSLAQAQAVSDALQKALLHGRYRPTKTLPAPRDNGKSSQKDS